MKKALLSWPNLYIIVAVLYLCLGPLLKGISVLTLSVHGAFLFMTLYFMLMAFKKCKFNIVMKALTLLYCLINIYGLILAFLGTDALWKVFVPASYYLEIHFRSIAPIFVFYYFSEMKMITSKWFCYVTPLFLFAVFQQYLFTSELSTIRYDADTGNFTNNAGYYFLSVLPIAILFREKKIIQYALIIFLTIMIVYCMKRGSILCAALIDFIIITDSIKKNKGKLNIILLLLFTLFIFAYFINDMFLNNDYFRFRYEQTLEGVDSNRGKIVNSILDFFFEQDSIFHYLFGYGANATARFIGIRAHNDWIEILISMGLLGVTVYFYYWIVQFKIIHLSKKNGLNRSIFLVLLCIVISNFLKSIFSNSLMGYCLSQCNIWNINKINLN